MLRGLTKVKDTERSPSFLAACGLRCAAPSIAILLFLAFSALYLFGSRAWYMRALQAYAGLFNAQFMTRMARIAAMPPKAMRCRASVMLRTLLKRRMLAANERRRAKMPGLQRMRLASSAKLLSRT